MMRKKRARVGSKSSREIRKVERLLARFLDEGVSSDELERAFDESAGMSNPELTKLYGIVKSTYRELTERAKRVSRGSGGIPSADNRMFWASILFTRLCVMSRSILQLLPDTKPLQHWDFSSVASMARNLSEAYLVYFWLCQDDVLDEVRAGRFILLYLHDYGSRKRLFPEQYEDDSFVYADLERKFDANLYLRTFTPTKRSEALKGLKTPFVQDDVLKRMGIDLVGFRYAYRFFSQHTHTGPMSFYRMRDHDRGSGVETRQEKRYMILAICFAVDILNRAIEGHLKIFPYAEMRTPFLTDQDVELAVEVAQGRKKAAS